MAAATHDDDAGKWSTKNIGEVDFRKSRFFSGHDYYFGEYFQIFNEKIL